MPPKRKSDVKAALYRVEDGLRRLFRSRPAIEPSPEPDTCLSYTEWEGLERFSGILNMNVEALGPLTSTIGRFSGFVTMFENQARARKEYNKLGTDLNDLLHTLAEHFDKTGPSSISVDSVRKLARNIDEETKLLESDEDKKPQDDRSTTEDVDKALRCYRRVRTVLATFAMNESTKMWRTNDDEVLNTRLELLSHSPGGHYRAFGSMETHRTGCMPNTRTGVLQDLREWVHYGKFRNVYWLHGIAGSGKTTIAYSLCEYLENSGKPAASFFCSRDLPACRDVKRILPSISYQLARLSRPFRCAISSVLEQDPEACNQPVDEQFKRLIAMPLQDVGHTFGVDVVLVIDALDECDDKDGVNQILDACFEGSSGLPVRFLITSRRNPGMLERMLASQGGQRRAELQLDEVDRTVAQEDVRTYLRAKLERVGLSDDDLECLVQRSGGLFLYAASVVRYLGQEDSPDGAERLKRLLDISPFTESIAYRNIDVLYTTILEEAVEGIDPESSRLAEVMLVLRTALCAGELVTMETVAGLLRLDFDRLVQTVLHPLLPVLHVSNADELGMMLYGSFASYLGDPHRSGRFYCDVHRDNSFLAELCFAVIGKASPSFNVCNLESSYLLDREVVGINDRANESISHDLWYACQNWATHLKLAGRSDELFTSLHNFLSRQLLLWVEVMNLKHHISEAARLLHSVYTWLQEAECPATVQDLVLDAWQFVEGCSSSAISESTPHIDVSALRFWPVDRPVSVHYMPLLRCVVKATGAMLERRGEGATAVDGSGSRVGHSLQRSELITGGGGNLSPLQADTRLPVDKPLAGHTSAVRSIAFSPDGAYVASGSFDRTVRIWNAQTGQPVGQPLEGHTDAVFSVAYSPDGAYIASGSYDRIVRIWNAHTRRRVGRPLKGHISEVRSVAYSPNGAYIASGSNDNTIRIWDAHTGQAVGQSLVGHADGVLSVAYSPDGAYISSGSWDTTVRIWDAHAGQPVGQPLNGHSGGVLSVAYSPDGAYIVSGSEDKTIRIWDAHRGKRVGQPLTGHTDYVRSVAYSPDGAYIVSGSDDMTVQIWEAHTGKPVGQSFNGHAGWVLSVTYSPDGAFIASGSRDKTARIWDSRPGNGARPTNPLLQSSRAVAHPPHRSLFHAAFAHYVTRVSKKPALAINNSHTLTAKQLLYRWALDDRGWVVNANQDRLIWVPQHLREFILLPPTLAIMPLGNRVILDFRGAQLGTEWRGGFDPGQLCLGDTLSGA